MTSTPDESEKEQAKDTPGKVRTWWHPVLAGFLRWQLGGHYQLLEEVPVGQKPLQIDFLLVQKQHGELPVRARELLAGLAERLNDYTMVELKSPSDTLRAGDFQTLLASALLYRAQNDPLLDPARLTLFVIAPALTRPYKEELRLLGVTPTKQEQGGWRLEGQTLGPPVWLLETGQLTGRVHPVLTLVSPTFLREVGQTYDELHRAGNTELVVYMVQQVQQFKQRGREFAMQHLGAEEEMDKVLRDLLLASASVENRLAGLSPEQRIAGLSPEQLIAGMSPEALERLKDVLQQRTRASDPPA